MTNFLTRVGNVEIASMSDGSIRFRPEDFFPRQAAADWEPYRDEMTSDGKLEMNLGSFLLRSEAKTVLVDTGLGPRAYDFEDVVYGKLMEDFRTHAVDPAEVDIVLMTHLHRDHVGWNFTETDGESRPTFPNARYLVPQADWDIFTRRLSADAFEYIKEQVFPLQELGMLELFEGEVQLTGELITLPTPGHTRGHTSLLISSDGEKGVVLGDASHVAIQAQETDWSPVPDVDPEQSAASRSMVMDLMEQASGLIAAGHYPAPGLGRLLRLEGRRYWQAI